MLKNRTLCIHFEMETINFINIRVNEVNGRSVFLKNAASYSLWFINKFLLTFIASHRVMTTSKEHLYTVFFEKVSFL